jgi:hypothetical protein
MKKDHSNESLNAKLDLNLDDLDLSELETLSEESSYALPEAGATIGWNSCSSKAQQ